MRVFEAVLRKELTDNFRDRKALSTALIVTPLLAPAMMFFALQMLSGLLKDAATPQLPVVGAQYAPALVSYLRGEGCTVLPAPDDPQQAIASLHADVVLVIDADFPTALRDAQPAHVQLVVDSTITKSAVTLSRVEGLIEAYNSRISTLRLMARGVDPGIMRAVSVDRVEVGSTKAQGAQIVGSLPMMLILACFLGGLYVALDATAGERERQSIEALLYQPIRPLEVVLAKAAATTVFSVLSLVMSIGAFALVLPFLPLDRVGVVLHFDVVLALRLLLLLLPLACMGSAVLMVVGTLSKSFRTAQAAMSVLVVGPMLPGLVTMMYPLPPTLPYLLVPTLGEAILATRLIRGETVTVLAQLTTASADALATVVLLALAARLFGPRLLTE